MVIKSSMASINPFWSVSKVSNNSLRLESVNAAIDETFKKMKTVESDSKIFCEILTNVVDQIDSSLENTRHGIEIKSPSFSE